VHEVEQGRAIILAQGLFEKAVYSRGLYLIMEIEAILGSSKP